MKMHPLVVEVTERLEDPSFERALAELLRGDEGPMVSAGFICSDLDISKPTLWRSIKRGDYPSLIEISPGRKGQTLRRHREFKRMIINRSATAPPST